MRSFVGQAACRDATRRASSIASEPFRLHTRPPLRGPRGAPAEGGPGGRWTGAPSPDRDRAEAWAGDRRSCAKPTAMTTCRTGVVGTTPPPPPPSRRPHHRRLRDSDLDRAENPPVTSNPATLRRPSRSATPRPRGAGRPDPPPAVTGTRSDPDRDAHHCVLPRHRTAPALPAWRPARRVDGVRRRGPQRLGRTVDPPGNDFLEVMVAGGKPSDGVYSDATSVVGLAYLGWLSAISVSLSRALVVGAHPPPPRKRVLICDDRYGCGSAAVTTPRRGG